MTGYRWGHSEDTLHLAAALRNGLASRGIPTTLYLDNGSAMVSIQLLRALAVLGIQLTHSKPGRPEGRGKIERFFRTVRDQFLIELTTPDALDRVDSLAGLNELFTGWVETVYHQRMHSETGQSPLARFTSTDPRDRCRPAPSLPAGSLAPALHPASAGAAGPPAGDGRHRQRGAAPARARSQAALSDGGTGQVWPMPHLP